MTSDHQSEAHLTELLEGKNLLPPGINSFFQETSPLLQNALNTRYGLLYRLLPVCKNSFSLQTDEKIFQVYPFSICIISINRKLKTFSLLIHTAGFSLKV